MDEKALAKKLEQEGFRHTFVWQDRPNASYPDHTHAEETAHIVISGEMTLTMGGKTQTYRACERCDVPAGALHSARMGPKGCRYLIGER
jgi:quercetin dioxygenase-like cupin family protein